MISVISPIFNEEDSLRNLCERIGKTLVAIGEEDYEILLVDNGSHDGSLETIKLLREQDKILHVKVISSRVGIVKRESALCSVCR